MGGASVPVAEDQPAVGAAARPGAETRYERIAIVRLGSLDDQAVPLPSHGSDGERFGAGRIAIPGGDSLRGIVAGETKLDAVPPFLLLRLDLPSGKARARIEDVAVAIHVGIFRYAFGNVEF